MLQTRRATCATARRRRVASTVASTFRLSPGSAHQAPPCPPSLGGRSPGESTKRASRATSRIAARHDVDNLRTSTWTTRRKLPPPRPSDRMPTPIPASCATPASERNARISHPPARALSSQPPFRCRRALFFGDASVSILISISRIDRLVGLAAHCNAAIIDLAPFHKNAVEAYRVGAGGSGHLLDDRLFRRRPPELQQGVFGQNATRSDKPHQRTSRGVSVRLPKVRRR